MSIGSRIYERRKELGLTQQDLAEAVSVSFQAVSSWERDEYLPDTEKLPLIAKALSTKISWIMEEDGATPNRWELHDAMFSVDHMLSKVRNYARARDMKNTLKALRLMEKYHAGAYRKGAEKVPYIIHPLMLSCHAFALGIADDILIPACLLHDVLEDTPATPEDLGMPEEVIEAVQLVSFDKTIAPTKEEAEEIYYNRIGTNRVASMVKLLDRCNNISTMATGFTREKMAQYIDETEKYVLPLLDKVKYGYDEYYDATFLLKYQMKSILETLKRTL